MEEQFNRPETEASGGATGDATRGKPRRIEEFPEVLETARTFTLKGLVAAFVIGVLSHVVADMGIHHFRDGPKPPIDRASVGIVCPEPSKSAQVTVAPDTLTGQEDAEEPNAVDREIQSLDRPAEGINDSAAQR